MFWCPNAAVINSLYAWWPGADYVDIVGIDDYPPATGGTFGGIYGDFYKSFAAAYNKHFAIGETGVRGGGTPAAKESWLSQIVNADLDTYPCYKSATWFEYYKQSAGYDYRLIQDQSAETVRETLSNFK